MQETASSPNASHPKRQKTNISLGDLHFYDWYGIRGSGFKTRLLYPLSGLVQEECTWDLGSGSNWFRKLG